MARETPWFAGSLVLAVLAGAIDALRINLPPLLVSGIDANPSGIGPILTGLAFVSALVHPIGSFLVGYIWGRQAAVETAYGRYILALIAAAVGGFILIYLVTLLPLMGQISGIGALSGRILMGGLFALSLVGVALVAFSGAALAYFRHSPTGGS